MCAVTYVFRFHPVSAVYFCTASLHSGCRSVQTCRQSVQTGGWTEDCRRCVIKTGADIFLFVRP